MRLSDYLDAARAALPSDRALGRALGVHPTMINHFRTRGVLPADETMVRLAQLAGIDPERALLDLCTWRAGEPAASVYRAMLARLTTAATVLLALAGPVQARPLPAADIAVKSIHYAMRVRQRGAVAP